MRNQIFPCKTSFRTAFRVHSQKRFRLRRCRLCVPILHPRDRHLLPLRARPVPPLIPADPVPAGRRAVDLPAAEVAAVAVVVGKWLSEVYRLVSVEELLFFKEHHGYYFCHHKTRFPSIAQIYTPSLIS